MANFEFDQTKCCKHGSSAACNKPHYVSTALNDTGNLKQQIVGPASYDSITNEIDNCRPVAMAFTWKETDKPSVTGAHAVVIAGYSDGLLYLEDPQGPESNYFDYDDLKSGEGPYYNLTITSWDETDLTQRSPY
jgi:uncharacterized protein YvpB